jgi:hypothetical protein
MTDQTYDFFVFKETDLTQNGAKNFFVGSTITMPTETTVTMSVTDDDGSLSGDNITSESSDDNTGQTATITDSEGNELGNGGKIYGEVYYEVSDSLGNVYRLVEIEQEGTGGDFFAFVADYGFPPAGAELTVDRKLNIKDSTFYPDYESFGASVVDPGPEPEPEPQGDYQFTAYNEFDLITVAGKKNLFVGDTIVIPDEPTVFVSVTDDDGFLSGDNITTEFADDESGQTAAITNGNGQEIGNGNQIFGECFYWVSDANGNQYQLIEVEQEGSKDDYFAFHQDFGAPEAGTELHVDRKVNVKNKTMIIEYDDLITDDELVIPMPEDDYFML